MKRKIKMPNLFVVIFLSLFYFNIHKG